MAGRVVALGGGHGLSVTLSAVRSEVTAVVTTSDNGGSSGRLRGERGGVALGDLRMALCALGTRADAVRAFQTRLDDGHPVGNLVLFQLAQEMGLVGALEHAGLMVGARGRVLPMTELSVDLVATVDGFDVFGEISVGSSRGLATSLRLVPEVPTHQGAIDAISAADLIVLGPGSIITSITPHLMMPAIHAALGSSRAPKVLVLNLDAQAGETDGWDGREHLRWLARHGGDAVDIILADTRLQDEDLQAQADQFGASVRWAPLSEPGRREHSVELLGAALEQFDHVSA